MRLNVLWAAAAAVVALSMTSGAFAADKQKIVIGFVAKSQSNPVFQAAHAGARDAAKELGEKYGVEIELNIQTPPNEDAQKQAQAVEQLAQSGAQGIAVSCTDAGILKTAIDKAVDAGAAVMCFDSDSPKSKRFAYYGTNDAECGKVVMNELAKLMGEKGTIAVLAGNQSAPNLRARAKGVTDTLPNFKGMSLLKDGTFYHEETPEKAAAMVQAAQNAHPEIQGWAMIGGWPLFARDALKWEPGTIKVVAVDALPPELSYLKSGHVDVLLAQDCYGWGYKSVEMLLEKVVKGNAPKDPMVIDPLTRVTKDNADEWSKKWDKWLKK